MSDLNIHRPHHNLINMAGEYFITGRIFDRHKLIHDDERKSLFFDTLVDVCLKHDLELIAWMIADDHYHAMVVSEKSFNIGQFVKGIHGATSKMLNDFDGVRGRKVWDQYWDRRIRDEKDSWMTFNYNHWNPIKHGFAKNLLEAADYKFCSLGLWIELLGEEVIELFYEQYPINSFNPTMTD